MFPCLASRIRISCYIYIKLEKKISLDSDPLIHMSGSVFNFLNKFSKPINKIVHY